MEIRVVNGIAFRIISKMDYPFHEDHTIAEDISHFYADANTMNVVLLRTNTTKPIMTYIDVLEEIEYLHDYSIRWRNDEIRDKLRLYYQKVADVMKSCKREEKINKLLEVNKWEPHLAC
jgi:hypothetical protein